MPGKVCNKSYPPKKNKSILPFFGGTNFLLLHPGPCKRQEIFDLGGIPNVIAAMTKFRRDADVQVAGAMV